MIDVDRHLIARPRVETKPGPTSRQEPEVRTDVGVEAKCAREKLLETVRHTAGDEGAEPSGDRREERSESDDQDKDEERNRHQESEQNGPARLSRWVQRHAEADLRFAAPGFARQRRHG